MCFGIEPFHDTAFLYLPSFMALSSECSVLFDIFPQGT